MKKINKNPGAELFKIERLRLIKNKPFLLEKTYLAVYNFRDLKKDELVKSSLFRIIKDKYNIQLSF